LRRWFASTRRAFQALREKGLGDEEIAARFFVTTAVVKQRLRLAAVFREAPRRLCRGRHDAGAVYGVHRHQRPCASGAGLGGLSRSYNKEAYFIRRQLTEGAVRASDRRAQFVGMDVYEPPAESSCATSSSMTMAAGCRIQLCSISS
jgi:ParB family chromosome partitioning protein